MDDVRGQERLPGVAVGMVVRDADGKRLGKVSRCDPWGFEVLRGFWSPLEWVIRWDEVLEVKGGEVHVARSDDALFELAAGGLPRTWRRTLPPAAPPGPGRGPA